MFAPRRPAQTSEFLKHGVDRWRVICTGAVQVLGGYGYMRELGVEKMLAVSNARVELLLAARDRDLLT